MRNAIRIIRGWTAGALVAVLVLAGAGASQASVILSFSQTSSGGVPASYMDALLTFDVSGNTLTMTMANQTANPPESFYINQIFFNATSNVTDLTLVNAPDGWSLDFAENGHKADGLGYYDVALIGGNGNHPGQVALGETTVFTLAITGIGPFADSNFTTEKSLSSNGDTESLAVAKFVRGSDSDDSAFGNATTAVIPEPATMAFLAIGVVTIMARRLGDVRRVKPRL